jgi:hypothetical protein
VRNQIPTNLRRWQERAAARALADAILRGDRRRARRMAINDDSGGSAPAPIKKREGAFDALKHHPLYRAPRHPAQQATARRSNQVMKYNPKLSAADAELVQDCSLEAYDAKSGEGGSLCSLGRDHDYTPYSDNMEINILHRLASSAIDDARAVYRVRVEEIFGSVSQHALDFFEQRLSDGLETA